MRNPIPKWPIESYITFGYITALLIIAFLSTIGTYFLYKVVRSDSEASRVVNVISAQQNRIQNIALLTWAIQDARLESSIIPLKSRLLRTVHELEKDHDLLMNHVVRNRDVKIYENLDREIRTYAASARYLGRSEEMPKAKNDLLVSILLEKANSHLTSKLSNLHTDYMQRHTLQLERYNFLSVLGLSVIMLVLIMEGLFLFRPLVKLVQKEHAHIMNAKDAADQANRVKTEFLANVSHEIRTPLTVIIGYSDVLLTSSTISNADLVTSESIKKNATHLKTLIDDLLDLAKVEDNKIDVQEEFFDLNAVLHEITGVFEFNAKDKNIAFGINYDTPLPRYITSDPLRIKQVIINLLSNAFKFTSQGEVRLHVRYDPATNGVYFLVADTGIGIEEEKQGKLFKRFYQVDSSLSRATGGSGIGLALSKSICESLGGDLEIKYSEPGRGSAFVCKICAGKVSMNDLVSAFSKDEKPDESRFDESKIAGKLDGMRILLVEDGPEIQQIYAHFLQLAGAKVHMESNGEDGMHAALANDFDLVLMDIQMPKMDGYAATQQLIAKNYPKPIIALTAHAMKEEREKCVRLGFSDYITKPIALPKLISIIARYNPYRYSGTEAIYDQPTVQQGMENDTDPIPSIYGHESIYVPLIKEFCKNLPGRLQGLKDLYLREDWPQLAREAHKIKGAAASYGYPILSDYARDWESLAKSVVADPKVGSGTQGESKHKIAQLDRLCERIVAGSPA